MESDSTKGQVEKSNNIFFVFILLKTNAEKAQLSLNANNWRLVMPLHSIVDSDDKLLWLVIPPSNSTHELIEKTIKEFADDWLIKYHLDEMWKAVW